MKKENGAGKYGDYNCDLPLEAAKAQVNWMK
jgi:hypothetical protein